MGINSQDLDLLLRLREKGHISNQASIIEVGAQQLSNNFLAAPTQFEKLGRLFNARFPHPFPEPKSASIIHGVLEHQDASAHPARHFWQWLGCTYASIDIDGSPGSIPLDLNYDDVPKTECGKHHLVTNFGTTEHVANQLNAFKIIHDLTAVGGIMMHNLPTQGMLNHGLVNYNPKFFWLLAASNRYKCLYADYTSAASYYDLPQNIIDNVAAFNPDIIERGKQYQIADSAIVIILQKISDAPFAPPLELPETTTKKTKKRYWNIFKKPKTTSSTEAALMVDQIINEAILPHHHSFFWGDRLLTIDKSAGFLSDPTFSAAYQAIRGSHQYDQYASPHTIAWRLHTLTWAAQTGLHLAGDFVECGVFKGDMSWFISEVVDLKSHAKQFYLYDTFEGFSDKYSSADDFPDNPNFLAYANSHYNNPELYAYVCDRFRDRPDINVIKGVVPDVLLKKVPEKIAFLHIDLNSPAAEIGALEILFPRLSSGGVLVFDDYGWKQFYKQKEAEDAFMAARGYKILELPTGQGVVIKR